MACSVCKLRASKTEATGSDKLVALSKLLAGPPKDLISELPLSDHNYEVALKLLDDNYDVPELRQRDVLANIVKVPHVRHHNDTAALRELLNVAQRTILALDAVSVPLHSIALPCEQTIWNALPTNILLSFEDRCVQDGPVVSNADSLDQAAAAAGRLERLLSFLRRFFILRERVSGGEFSAAKHRVGDLGGQNSKLQKPRDSATHPPRQTTVVKNWVTSS